MRNKSSVQFTTVIMLISILTVFSQFCLLHFLKDDLKATFIASGIVLLVSIILLTISYNYEVIFIYMFLNVVLSSLLAAYSFWEISYFYYSITNYKLWLIIVNFFVPWIVCFFVSMSDTNKSIINYRQFIRNSSLLFLVFYIGVFVYAEFLSQSSSIWTEQEINVIPFYTIAAHIEDYIYKTNTLMQTMVNVLLPCLLFVPAGFLIYMCMRQWNRLPRLIIILLVPILVEVVQVFVKTNGINIDDVILGFLGGLLGQILFLIVNGLFLYFKGESFIEDKTQQRPELHF